MSLFTKGPETSPLTRHELPLIAALVCNTDKAVNNLFSPAMQVTFKPAVRVALENTQPHPSPTDVIDTLVGMPSEYRDTPPSIASKPVESINPIPSRNDDNSGLDLQKIYADIASAYQNREVPTVGGVTSTNAVPFPVGYQGGEHEVQKAA